MFHGIASQRNGHLVELFVRIGNAEIFFEQIHDVRSGGGDILGLSTSAPRHDDANLGAVRSGVTRRNDVHRANSNGHEITWQWLGFRELYCPQAVIPSSFRNHRRVREGAIILGNIQSELPWHLE